MSTTWKHLAEALEALDLAKKHLPSHYRCDAITIAVLKATAGVLALRRIILTEGERANRRQSAG